MARIRTIKPDFWTDEKVVELDLPARLFFIGSWNFADDNGNLQRSAKKLKMQIFPADAIDCEPIIQSLITQGMLSEYEVNGEKFLHIKGFRRHQVINRPSKTGLPTPSEGSTPQSLTEDSLTEGKGVGSGREGNGKERNKTVGTEDVVGTPAQVASEKALARPAELSAVMRRHSIESQPGDPRIVAAAEAGVTVETIEAACAEAKSSDTTGRVKPGYVLSIAERWTRDAAAPRSQARASPGYSNARDESRKRAYEVLTGKTQPVAQPETVEAINGHVKLIG